MSATNLIERARKAQKNIISIEETQRMEAKAIRDIIEARRTRFNDQIKAIEQSLESLNGMPIKAYYWREQNSGYRVNSLTTSLILSRLNLDKFDRYTGPDRIELNKDTNELRAKLSFFEYYQDEFTLEIKELEGKFIYIFNTTCASLDRVKEHYYLDHGKVWTSKGDLTKTLVRTNMEQVVEDIQEFILKIIDLERAEENEQKNQERSILAKHLGVGPTTMKVEQNRNSVGTKFVVEGVGSFRVLKKGDAQEWFKFLVADDVANFFDLELAAENSEVKIEEWKSLKNSVSKNTLSVIAKTCVSADRYAKSYVNRYSFDKYLEAAEGYFIVNLDKLFADKLK